MVPRRHVLTGVLLVGIATGFVMFQGVGNFTVSTEDKGTQDGTGSIQLAKQLRPAASAESPEDNQLKKQPPPVKPETLQPPSKAELLDACNKQPGCRQKLESAQKGQKPTTPRPAATAESPEESQFKKQPPPPAPTPPPAPRSDLLSPKDSSLFSWLNPFGIAEAQAQMAFSVTLTPQSSFSQTPYGAMYLFGSHHWAGGSHSLENITISTFAVAENRPYVTFSTSVPSTGWYIINVKASRAIAKLRHLWTGPIIETWDFTTSATTCNPCDFATMEYLAAGYQVFYFWVVPSSTGPSYSYIYQVSIQSYP